MARTPVGQAVDAVAGGLFGPITPKPHTASSEYGAAFIARASQPYDSHVFRYNWAVRGPWLVFYHYDGDQGLIDLDSSVSFVV